MKLGIVYLIQNKKNRKEYVGFTSHDANQRWRDHIRSARHGNDGPLCCAIRKYGPPCFSIRILWSGSLAKAKQMEQVFIRKRRTFIEDGGYNLTYGGEGTLGRRYSHSMITRQKMVNTARQAYANGRVAFWTGKVGPFKDHQHSLESREKMSTARKLNPTCYWLGKSGPFSGKRLSEAHKENIRKAKKGILVTPMTDEIIRKISAAKVGKPLSTEHKRSLSLGQKRSWAEGGKRRPQPNEVVREGL